MDPDEVTRLVNELKLSSEADTAAVDVTETISLARSGKLKNYLVGKIFSIRVVNREALRNNLPRILQLRRDVEIEIVGDNIFVIAFKSDEDKTHVLKDGPWHYFESLIVFKETTGWQKPTDLVFEDFTTWIQLHNLPIACMNPKSVTKIAEQVGVVEEVDIGEGGNCIGQFARVRVTRPISRPLQRCVRISQEQSKEQWIVLILYEKLPEFCFQCGRVGHVKRHCQEDQLSGSDSYGYWLKAKRAADTRRKKESDQTENPKHKESPKILLPSPSHGKELHDPIEQGGSTSSLAEDKDGEAANMIIEEAGKETQCEERAPQNKSPKEIEESGSATVLRSPKVNSWKRRARASQKDTTTKEPRDGSGGGQKRILEEAGFEDSFVPPSNMNETHRDHRQEDNGIGRASKKKQKTDGSKGVEETELPDLSAVAAVQSRRTP